MKVLLECLPQLVSRKLSQVDSKSSKQRCRHVHCLNSTVELAEALLDPLLLLPHLRRRRLQLMKVRLNPLRLGR